MANMSIDNLKNNLSNPARTYLWDVIIPRIVGEGDSDVLMLRCQSANIPGRSVGEILVPYKQSAGVKYPGKLTYPHTWDCTFIEGEDKKIFDAIYSWEQQIINDVTNVGIGDILIKSDIYLKMLSTKGENYMNIRLIGCYPQDVGDIAVSYDDEASVMYPVTWSYDRWEEYS